MHKTKENEQIKYIEEFIRQSIVVILNSRIKISMNKTADYTNSKMNKMFFPYEPKIVDIDEIFLDEYQEIKNTKDLMSNYILEIYFKRKELKLLIEKWSFKFIDHNPVKKEIDCYVIKKLSVLLRTIYIISRVLPAFTFYQKCGFFTLEYKFYKNLKYQELFRTQTSKMKFKNLCTLMDFTLKIEFLSKIGIFRLEDELTKKKQNTTLYKRPRYLSEDNHNVKVTIPSFEILNFEDTMIKDNHFLINDINIQTILPNNKNNVNPLFNIKFKRALSEDKPPTVLVKVDKWKYNNKQCREFRNYHGLEFFPLSDHSSSLHHNGNNSKSNLYEKGVEFGKKYQGVTISSCINSSNRNFKNEIYSSITSSSNSFELEYVVENSENEKKNGNANKVVKEHSINDNIKNLSTNNYDNIKNLPTNNHINKNIQNNTLINSNKYNKFSKNCQVDFQVEEILKKSQSLKLLLNNFFNINFNYINFLSSYKFFSLIHNCNQ